MVGVLVLLLLLVVRAIVLTSRIEVPVRVELVHALRVETRANLLLVVVWHENFA